VSGFDVQGWPVSKGEQVDHPYLSRRFSRGDEDLDIVDGRESGP